MRNTTEKPVHHSLEEEERAPYKMIQTVGLSVGAAVAYIIVVLGLMFYCKKRRNAKRLDKGPEGEEAEHLNGQSPVGVCVILHNPSLDFLIDSEYDTR